MKSIKVFYMDKRLKDIYPHATPFQVFKYKFMRGLRKLTIFSFILGAIYGAFHIGRVTTEPVFVKAEDKSEALFAERIDALKNRVVTEIQTCERAGYVESDGLVTYDPQQGEKNASKIPSFGTMQFKKSTVQYYYKTLYGKEITPKEAVLIALDDEKAKALAKDIMFKSKNMAGDWLNCSRKVQSDDKIKIIKSLEK